MAVQLQLTTAVVFAQKLLSPMVEYSSNVPGHRICMRIFLMSTLHLKMYPRSHVVVQWVKLLPMMPASNMGTDLYLGYSSCDTDPW